MTTTVTFVTFADGPNSETWVLEHITHYSLSTYHNGYWSSGLALRVSFSGIEASEKVVTPDTLPQVLAVLRFFHDRDGISRAVKVAEEMAKEPLPEGIR